MAGLIPPISDATVPHAAADARVPHDPEDCPPDATPAFVAGTSSEFLGRRPLPRVLQERPVVFLYGPPGVGKTVVARRILGEAAIHLCGQRLLDALAWRARHRRWEDELRGSMPLIVDGPCFLARRPSVQKWVHELLLARAEGKMRTAVCESADGSAFIQLMGGVSPELRATLSLRFPEGRGRRRFVNHLCDELGVDPRVARPALELEPWTYDRVRQELLRLRETGEIRG